MTVAERVAAARIDRSVFERLSDSDLASLLDAPASGWGATQRVAVDGRRAFVKRVPMTAIEVANSGSTANLYAIPPHLNYPYGSPGINVGRELQFALTSTRWVEDGTCTGFPILLHHRVLDRGGAVAEARGSANYTAYRGDDPAMNRYLADRDRAPADLILCYEDLPHAATDRITEHPADATWIVDDVRTTIAFLRGRDTVHFDVDLFNVLTDGRSTYLADHGLVMDSGFELDDLERQFLDANRHFDDGNLILSLGHQLHVMFRAAPADRRSSIERELGLEGLRFEDTVERLIDAVDRLDESGLLPIGAAMRVDLARYGDVIRFMHRFFTSARSDWSRRTALDDDTLAALLAAAD
jgi:hypothetical protein